MNQHYDAIIVGGGHNGLVAAATLAGAGRRVLVLEKRNVLGGAAATEELFPGYRVDTGATDAALFQDEIIQKLDLTRHGLSFRESPALLFAPQPDGRGLTIWRDEDRTVAEIAAFSKHDAARWPAFRRQVEKMAGLLRGMMLLTPPDLGGLRGGDVMSWAPLALRLRRLGGGDMMELFRVLPMAVQAYLDEWFESDALKGALGGSAVTGSALGPRSAGTNLMFLYQNLGGLLAHRFVLGGIGRLSAALAETAQANGATIRTGAGVARVLIEESLEPAAVGVRLDSGEEIRAAVVLANTDARRTLFDLVGPQYLEPEVMRHVRNIMYRGVTARLNLALSGLPEFAGLTDASQLGGRIRLSPSLDYLERAYDSSKYGRSSESPYLEMFIPTIHDPSLAPNSGNGSSSSTHILTITAQYAPYTLRNGDWHTHRDVFAETILATLESVSPGIRSQIVHSRMITPLEWESDYGLTEGSIYQGQMGLDQMLVMRPIPEWSRYETPVKNLYLCGAGAHPGGGVTGAPGYNAARVVLAAR
ncbi:MAG: NAD(P)/FAD-dependent oxidoreductase [Candidatus Promineofilum sp.]|uniref:phytoene desaturase family protein n=1 Tax=Promineifilum sp. TaxID=2664178 RepID=UPI002411BA69|nr:NAD(P)/FAD-dependent oxidoreductase [Promineifilum sp.]